MNQSTKTAGVLTIASFCKDCPASWSGGTAAYDAIAHHESTGHNIRVEQTIFWERKKTDSPPCHPPRPVTP